MIVSASSLESTGCSIGWFVVVLPERRMRTLRTTTGRLLVSEPSMRFPSFAIVA